MDTGVPSFFSKWRQRADRYIWAMVPLLELFQPETEMAPSERLNRLSGTTNSGSTRNSSPRPVQVGQAP